MTTYVFGYYDDKIIDSVEKYVDDENGIPSKFRIVAPEIFQSIISIGIPLITRLYDDGYWDRTRLVRQIRRFFPNELPKRYAVVFCDEAQDFTRIELRLIIQSSLFFGYDLTSVNQIPIVLAGDALQTVSPTGFSDTRLHQMYYETFLENNFIYKKERSTYNPKFNYRSSKPIVRLANVIQNFRKESLREEISIKQDSKRAGENFKLPILHTKEWILLPENTLSVEKKFKYKCFILPVDSNEENEFIKNERIFNQNEFVDIKSSIDAKGAEYSQTVVYGFGDQHLKDFGELSWLDNSTNFKKRFFFNKLYVAITRAQNELIIIDSEVAVESFWKPLLNIPSGVNRWELYNDLDDLVLISPHTGLREVQESTPNDALNNAILDMEQGINDNNSARLIVASNIFIQLGKIEDANNCLGHKEKIKKNWSRAGEHFLKAQKIDEAADCFFKAKAWSELITKTKSNSGYRQESRLLIAKLMVEGAWTRDELAKAYGLRNIIAEVTAQIDWYSEYTSKLISYAGTIKNLQEKREIVYVLESAGRDEDQELWNLIGQLYFENKQFKNAIDAWDRIINAADPPKYFPDYIRASIEKAVDEQNLEEEFLWKGRLLSLGINQGERRTLSSSIIAYFQENKIQISNSKQKKELLYNIFIACVILGEFNLINEVGCEVENSITPQKSTELFEFCLSVVKDEFTAIFLKERWTKAKWKSLIEVTNESERLIQLNAAFLSREFPFESSNGVWTIEEINSISETPKEIEKTPKNHYETIRIRNFRGFDNLELNRLGQFNVILGNNNSGKTSLLEALLFSPDPDLFLRNILFTLKQRNNNSEKESGKEQDFLKHIITIKSQTPQFEFELQNGRTSWNYIIRYPSRSELLETNLNLEGDPKNYLAIKERNGPVKISNILSIVRNQLNNAEFIKHIPFVPFGKGYLDNLSSVYFSEIGMRKSNRDSFIEKMRLFIPNINDISINPDNDVIMIGEIVNNIETSMPLYNYGEGANKLFRILVQLYAAKGKTLMIDEIDVGVHYSRFKEFMEVIFVIAYDFNVQLFVTTHNDEWLKVFISFLNSTNIDLFKEKSRIITMERHVETGAVVPILRDYSDIKFVASNNYELRGRKL